MQKVDVEKVAYNNVTNTYEIAFSHTFLHSHTRIKHKLHITNYCKVKC